MTLIPAYGRDYTSAAKVLADWDANKDFIIADFNHPYSGKPANKMDIKSEGLKSVFIRYNKDRKVLEAKV